MFLTYPQNIPMLCQIIAITAHNIPLLQTKQYITLFLEECTFFWFTGFFQTSKVSIYAIFSTTNLFPMSLKGY